MAGNARDVGETERVVVRARLRAEVDRAKLALAAARARERPAGPAELRLLTSRLQEATDQLRRWQERWGTT